MDDLVSIIIPVYNSEKYLERCLDSVLSQTYNNIEVILIDDGSEDDSLSICKAYEKRDKRVKAIHQDNSGAAAARNTGLDKAGGEYIMFCDSDDVVSKLWVEHMVSPMKKDERVMPFCAITSKLSDLEETVNSQKAVAKEYCSVEGLFTCFDFTQIGFLFNTLFLKSEIERLGLRFRVQKDKADYNEDLLFVTEYLKNIDLMYFSGVYDYAYCGREDSLSTAYTPYYFEKFAEKFDIWNGVADYVGDESAKKDISTLFLYRFLVALQDAFNRKDKEKFKRIVLSNQVQACLRYADTSKEDARVIKLVRIRNVSLLWFYHGLIKRKKSKNEGSIF